jgi:hypothetical protein
MRLSSYYEVMKLLAVGGKAESWNGGDDWADEREAECCSELYYPAKTRKKERGKVGVDASTTYYLLMIIQKET